MSSRRRVTAALLGLLALVVAVYVGREVDSDDDSDPARNSSAQVQQEPAADPVQADGRVALSALPAEATEVWRLIEVGGPFRYEQDDRTFGNREGLLPAEPVGYYREYTIPTPGEDDRGARRFVLGREDELYYTDDHYESFVRVDPQR